MTSKMKVGNSFSHALTRITREVSLCCYFSAGKFKTLGDNHRKNNEQALISDKIRHVLGKQICVFNKCSCMTQSNVRNYSKPKIYLNPARV